MPAKANAVAIPVTNDRMDILEEQWKAERPDLKNVEVFALYGRLARLVGHLDRAISELQKEHGFSRGDFDVLATLRRSGKPYELTPTELYKSVLLTSGAMTSRIDRLEKEGWVLRLANANDRRSNRVKLTDIGRQMIDNFLPEHLSLERHLIASLSETEQLRLNSLLKKWLAAIEPL